MAGKKGKRRRRKSRGAGTLGPAWVPPSVELRPATGRARVLEVGRALLVSLGVGLVLGLATLLLVMLFGMEPRGRWWMALVGTATGFGMGTQAFGRAQSNVPWVASLFVAVALHFSGAGFGWAAVAAWLVAVGVSEYLEHGLPRRARAG